MAFNGIRLEFMRQMFWKLWFDLLNAFHTKTHSREPFEKDFFFLFLLLSYARECMLFRLARNKAIKIEIPFVTHSKQVALLNEIRNLNAFVYLIHILSKVYKANYNHFKA